MSLFSGNRKVRARRAKSAQEQLKQEESPKRKSRQLARRSDELNDQIHRLECFITDAPRLKSKHRLENINIVPPMERSTPAPRNRRIPIAQQRARRSVHLRMLTEGLIVLGSIAAVMGWLNQWFHFWR
jgi:hypothetical protein